METGKIWEASPEAFVQALAAEGLTRAYLVTDLATRRLLPSHPSLEPLAAAVAAEADYRAHEGCFFELGRESGHLLSAFVHQTRRGQAAGGVRFWGYERLGDFVRDGLRLSRAMGQKNALAGLWWGGGKGVIARRPGTDHRDPDLRRAVYRDYGRFISGLEGVYVTAEDVGTTPADMAQVFATTRHTTCIPPELGGSGNPGVLTARGVVVAMEAALAYLDRGDLAGKSVALQGLGNVSGQMIEHLVRRGVKWIVGADIDDAAVADLRRRFPRAPLELRIAAPDDCSILAEEVDLVAPNAVGAVLNPRTIPTLRAPIVCGAANNQLERPDRDGAALSQRGVLYVPDFLANRMGIVNCANEQYGAFDGDPAVTAHLEKETPHGIYQRALEVFRRAEASGRSTAQEAELLADELAREDHPLWPGRGRQIIAHLVASGWARGGRR